MSDWQRELDIVESWQKAKRGKVHTVDLAKEIVEKLNDLQEFDLTFVDDGKQEVIDEFDEFIHHHEGCEDGEQVKRRFNVPMTMLYDWADMTIEDPTRGFCNKKKVCWIKTFNLKGVGVD